MTQSDKFKLVSLPPIEYGSVVEALRGAAEKYGEGAWKQLSFGIPKDKWPLVEAFIRKEGKDKLLEVILCRCAEVK